MRGTCELKTARLLLRKYRPEDAPILHRKFGLQEQMFEYSGWNPYATEEMAAETVKSFCKGYEDPGFYGWAIEYRGELIGTVGAYDYSPENQSIEIGLSIAQENWGKGFATEALACVLAFLHKEDGIAAVHAWCAPENIGSKTAMLRAGMTQRGVESGGLVIGDRTYDKLLFSYPAEREPETEESFEGRVR